MTDAATDRSSAAWLAGNQRYLSLRLVLVRAIILRHAARGGEASPTEPPIDVEGLSRECAALAAMTPPPTLTRLSATFGLSAFEESILLLCAGIEFDSKLGAACARAHGDPHGSYPTFGLALAAFPDAHWSALQPDAPLRQWRLIEFASGGSPGAPVTSRPLRIDERILHHLAGLGGLDERLAGVTARVPAAPALVPSHHAIAARIARAWRRQTADALPAIILYGADTTSARAVAASASRLCGWPLLSMSSHAIPAAGSEQASLARVWNREVCLRPSVLMIESDGAAGEGPRGAPLNDWVDRLSGPVVVVARERLQLGQRSSVGFEVSRPTIVEQGDMWTAALTLAGLDPQLDLQGLTSQFCLNVSEVQAATNESCLEDEGRVSVTTLWNASRRQARGRLDDLSQRIESPAGLDDLILPDGQKETLAEILTHVRHRTLVYETWGFAGRGARGLGICALFAGASGTGKTMAAEVLANAVSLDLYRVDLSSIVSKYIGETEKNLRRIFDAAEAGGAVLLFDEADALFGKRSEVKDSHDRYANVEVSYLLQRMESYRGLAILTTNMKSALDTAFLRRIRFIVEFPFPDATQRARIWQRAFPAATPTHGLDLERLAQLSVAGGGIKNVALSAAFLAADSNQPVGMAHVLRAARSEYAKLEKPLTDAEVAGWI